MEITFDKEYLRELFYNGKSTDKQHRYQPDIVKRYIRVVNILDSVGQTTDSGESGTFHYFYTQEGWKGKTAKH